MSPMLQRALRRARLKTMGGNPLHPPHSSLVNTPMHTSSRVPGSCGVLGGWLLKRGFPPCYSSRSLLCCCLLLAFTGNQLPKYSSHSWTQLNAVCPLGIRTYLSRTHPYPCPSPHPHHHPHTDARCVCQLARNPHIQGLPMNSGLSPIRPSNPSPIPSSTSSSLASSAQTAFSCRRLVVCDPQKSTPWPC